MLTIKVFLAESGAVADLHKDFPLFQKQFNNVLLSAYVPVSLLAPNFTVNSASNGDVVSPFVAGSAIKVGIRTVARNGEYRQSNAYYLRFVKTFVKNGVYFALFERKLPTEFAFYAGQGINAPKLIFNIENVEYGEITSATAVSSNDQVTANVNLATVKSNLPAISQNYVFTYSIVSGTGSFYLNGYPATLIDYGITLTNYQELQENDTITLSVVAQDPTTISISTTQEVALDILPSADFDSETMDASDYAVIEAQIVNILSGLLRKQDKQDYALQTQAKSVVGAINEIFNKSIYQEHPIGTYYYEASNTEDLPSDAQLLAFARTIMGNGYILKAGDVIIVVQILANATDTVYKYVYNGTAWAHYQIPAVENASNGTQGLIRGSYGTSDQASEYFNVALDIQNGACTHIYVKNTITGNYEDLTTAYMPIAIGATKQFVKGYALPKEFNDVLYFTADGFSDEIPDTPVSGIQFSATLNNSLDEVVLATISYTIGDLEYQLASKNSAIDYLYFAREIDDLSPTKFRFRIIYYIEDENQNRTWLLSNQLTNEISLEDDDIDLISFASNFSELGKNVIVVKQGDKLCQEISIVPSDAYTNTINLYCNTTVPSRFFLYTNVVAVTTAEIVQSTGTSVTDVMSQKAVTDELAGKQDTLTFDNSPSENSTNPVTSGGVYTAVQAAIDIATGKTTGYGIALFQNASFNSTTESLVLSADTVITLSDGSTITAGDLKVGDTIYIAGGNVPDRWVAAIQNNNVYFYAFDSKLDLSNYYTKSETDTLLNGKVDNATLSGYVPTSRTIAGIALSANISADDLMAQLFTITEVTV